MCFVEFLAAIRLTLSVRATILAYELRNRYELIMILITEKYDCEENSHKGAQRHFCRGWSTCT